METDLGLLLSALEQTVLNGFVWFFFVLEKPRQFRRSMNAKYFYLCFTTISYDMVVDKCIVRLSNRQIYGIWKSNENGLIVIIN